MDTIKSVEAACKELRLGKNISRNMKTIEEDNKELYLLRLLESEVAYRNENRIKRNIKNAGFYTLKSFSDYVFDDITFPDSINKEEISSVEFVKKKENIIMYGNSGTGKTHLSIAIGIKCCNENMKVGFYRTAGLVNRLIEAKEKNELSKFLNKLSKLDLLICDEWGYVPLNKEGGQLLFQVISDFYETKSLIITTNLEFSKWINIFYDKEMTAAMIDRLVHHSHLLIFNGESWRIKHSLIKKKFPN